VAVADFFIAARSRGSLPCLCLRRSDECKRNRAGQLSVVTFWGLEVEGFMYVAVHSLSSSDLQDIFLEDLLG
jgi:hypothetical protein